MAEWERELEVDPEALRRAAGSPRAWRSLGAGWDCDAWLADESVVWRAPRRRVGIAALEREAAVMPRLAPHLPAPAPIPTLVAVDGVSVAWHARVPGREMAEAARFGPGLGASLGRFLRSLHDPANRDRVGHLLPTDPVGRADPDRRVPKTLLRLGEIEGRIDTARLREIVTAAAGPALPTDLVCHGDLHVRHVLLDDDGELAGVIDWGDVCLGAPAMDLAIATALDGESRREFLDAYGPVDGRAWRHARLLGVTLGAALLAADPEGASGRGARRWLERLASEPSSSEP